MRPKEIDAERKQWERQPIVEAVANYFYEAALEGMPIDSYHQEMIIEIVRNA